MTEEAQRIAIAEFCGYSQDTKPDSKSNFWIHKGAHIVGGDWEPNPMAKLIHLLPDYLNDLNAIHEAEAWLDEQIVDVRSLYFDRLMLNADAFPNRFEGHWAVCRATAAQRAEALLRTIGKWKD